VQKQCDLIGTYFQIRTAGVMTFDSICFVLKSI